MRRRQKTFQSNHLMVPILNYIFRLTSYSAFVIRRLQMSIPRNECGMRNKGMEKLGKNTTELDYVNLLCDHKWIIIGSKI